MSEDNKEIALVINKQTKEMVIGYADVIPDDCISLKDCVIIIIQQGQQGEVSLIAVDYPIGVLPDFVTREVIDNAVYTFDKKLNCVYSETELSDKIKGWYTQVITKKKSNIEIIPAGSMPNKNGSNIIH